MRFVLDAMGGDHAPLAMLEGAAQALDELQAELVLVGDESVLKSLIAKKRRLRPLARALETPRVRIVHAFETIEMEDSIRAVRAKPGASINIGTELAAQGFSKNLPTAFVSAGHSGAVMASALMNLGRLEGIERPAIAIKLPTLKPEGCVFLDVGANVDCKPEHLRDFAVMGALFATAERGEAPGPLPRVAVLANGEERSKGNELTRAAASMIEELACFKGSNAVGNFTGYAEGKEIFKGQVDVVVADGFVGNVILKSLEGLGSAVVTTLKRESRASLLAPLGFLLASRSFLRLKRKLDYAEYGAAPLLGVAGYVFICHGRSNPRAIKNALLRAQSALRGKMVERLSHALSQTA